MLMVQKSFFLTPVIFHALILICFTLNEVSAVVIKIDLEPFWLLFKKIFSKWYVGEEEEQRRTLWEEKIMEIFLHNLKADLGYSTFRRGQNAFSDYTPEEVAKYLKGYIDPGNRRNSSHWVKPTNVDHPDEIDWRDHGLVTSIQDQGQCGCCWAFASVGALEGQHKKKSRDLVTLSAQHLVDCATNGVNNGCNGGMMSAAFEYIKDSEGVNTDKVYPYKEKQGECNFKPENVAATCTGYIELPKGDESALKDAVATIGPISCAMDTRHNSFLTYKSGIYDEPLCSNTHFDHAVLVIGYGTDDGVDYWLIKNSWGESWGMKGYMKLARNKHNMCGIANRATYPLV